MGNSLSVEDLVNMAAILDDPNTDISLVREILNQQNDDLTQVNTATREELQGLLNIARNIADQAGGFEGVTESVVESHLQSTAQSFTDDYDAIIPDTQELNPDVDAMIRDTIYQVEGDQVGSENVPTDHLIGQEIVNSVSYINHENVDNQYQLQQMVIGGIIFTDFFYCYGSN
ncbi:unnamed protein product [Meganyctiphanes norvegica]|uniref:Uncharacterized protein n=1 Tax=Meganyctiphanes norvegica TaxID=48144 RepID=A0AAV2QRG1_MEGNR